MWRYESKWRCEDKRDVVIKNVTQRYIQKRDATKPAVWRSENVALRGKKLRQLYIFQNVG